MPIDLKNAKKDPIRPKRLDPEVWDERDGIVPASPMNVGDAIVYGVTHEVELPDRTKIWPKFNASTTIRPSETAEQATDRLVGFVHDQIALRIKQAVQHSSTITL